MTRIGRIDADLTESALIRSIRAIRASMAF